MPTLFEEIDLGTLSLPNRIIMAPMSRNRADNKGVPTAMVAEYYAQRASAGLLIAESTYVSNLSRYANAPGLITPGHIEGWQAVTAAVHAQGGRIFAQLYHSGRVSRPELLPGGAVPIAPSAIAIEGVRQGAGGPVPFAVPRALERHEIADVVAEFANAAVRAISAGFDGVEIHAASGYLIHQFPDAASNRRDDDYGGSAHNRLRFLMEIVEAVSAAIGAQRTGVKFSPCTRFNGMIEPDADVLYPLAARALSAAGIAFLHVAVQPDYAAGRLRCDFSGAFLIGGGLDLESAAALVNSGAADAAVFGRPYLANPDLVRRLAEGLPLAQADPGTIYSGGAHGYSDYPPHT